MVSKIAKYLLPGDRRSYRRKLLDSVLNNHVHLMQGVVIDLAGKNVNYRGNFRPPTTGVERRIVVNLDPDVQPDVVADIRETGLDESIADCVILAETLQHVPSPERCISEAHRLLKPGGVFIGSIPFLYPVHRDPQDLIRFGPDGLEKLLEEFIEVKIYSMGNFFGVLGLMVERKISTVRSGSLLSALGVPKVTKLMMLLAAKTFTLLDRNAVSRIDDSTSYTTGYFFIGIKR